MAPKQSCWTGSFRPSPRSGEKKQKNTQNHRTGIIDYYIAITIQKNATMSEIEFVALIVYLDMYQPCIIGELQSVIPWFDLSS